MKKPIIGITVDYIDDGDKNRYSDFPWYALRRQYSEVIYNNGGIPIFLPFESYQSNSDEILKLIDGLIIPGGDLDVPPSMYNEEIMFDTAPCHARCENEKALILAVLERNMPFLGICHGMQLLNVILGGSLYQSILGQIDGAISHKQTMSRKYTHHNILLKEESLIAKITGKKEFAINSNHRQAVNKLGKNLIASGVCPDDSVIEALESTAHDFVLGIEWHPEIEASQQEDNLIFKALIEAALTYARERKIS